MSEKMDKIKFLSDITDSTDNPYATRSKDESLTNDGIAVWDSGGKLFRDGGYTLETLLTALSYLLKLTVYPSGLTEISDETAPLRQGYRNYDYMDSMPKVIIVPNGVTSIGSSAYEGNKIDRIFLPSSVKRIEDCAFMECKPLIDTNVAGNFIELHKGLEFIGPFAFRDCSNINTITIPSSVKEIGEEAFKGCTKLWNVQYDSSCDIPSEAFAGTPLAYLYFNGAPSTIGSGAFANCVALPEIVLPEGVITIKDGAFEGTSVAQKISIPDSVQYIEYGAFKDSGRGSDEQNLSFRLGKGVIEIDNEAFAQSVCVIGSIIFPVTLAHLGNSSFEGCTRLQVISLGQCANLDAIADSTFQDCVNLTSVTLPNTLGSIGQKAFYNCHSLTSIKTVGEGGQTNTLPMSISSIGDFAFSGGSDLLAPHITNITVPNTATLGEGVFQNCKSLETFSVSYNSDNLVAAQNIPANTFNGCVNLTTANPCLYARSIGDYAYNDCNKLTEITISGHTTEFGYGVFFGCNSLTKITYTGIGEQWDEILVSWNDGTKNPMRLSTANVFMNTVGDSEQFITVQCSDGALRSIQVNIG